MNKTAKRLGMNNTSHARIFQDHSHIQNAVLDSGKITIMFQRYLGGKGGPSLIVACQPVERFATREETTSTLGSSLF